MKRVREDQARRGLSIGTSEHQRTYITLPTLSRASSQPFSAAAAAASNLVRIGMTPEAVTGTAQPTNEQQPIALATSSCAVDRQRLYVAAPIPLVIMGAPSVRSLTDELLESDKTVETWKTMMMSLTRERGSTKSARIRMSRRWRTT